MSRQTDLQIIVAYRQVSSDLLECLHSSVEMLNRIGQVLPMGAAQQAFDIGMDDMEVQLGAIRERMKDIHVLAFENVRITLHGGDE